MPNYRGEERRADMKKIMKEALKEWLDEKFSDLGKWSFMGMAALTFAVIVFVALKFGGWSPLK